MNQNSLNKAKRLILAATFLGIILVVLALVNFNSSSNQEFRCGTRDPGQQIIITDTIAVEMTDSMKREMLFIDKGKHLFEDNCKSCHRIHIEFVGPALKGIENRRERKWIHQFVRNSKELIASGDSVAVSLFEEYNSNEMTAFPTFTDEEIDAIIRYVGSASDVQPTNRRLP